jgi:hypothetical protein
MKSVVFLLALATPAFAQNAIWMSRSEALQCPMAGPLWAAMLDDANSTIVPDVDNMDDNADARTLAVALVYLRLPNIAPYPPIPGAQTRFWYRDKVIALCDSVANTTLTDPEAIARNPLGYILAADMINLGQADPTVDAKFRTWISSWLGAARNLHDTVPANTGLLAGATRIAADIYIGDSMDELDAWDIFEGWLGVGTSPYTKQQWGGPRDYFAWQAEAYPAFSGINRIGTQKVDCLGNLRNVDGALPDDQRRGDCPDTTVCPLNCFSETPGCPPTGCQFTWPPMKTNYAYTGLQGVLGQAVIHYRRGRDPWTVPTATFAVRRAFEWLRDVAAHPVEDFAVNNTNDLWQSYVVNRLYPGLGLYEDLTTAVDPGFQVGYTDWSTRCTTWP